MASKRVMDGVHLVPMGTANAYLMEGVDGLTLVDAGFPDKEAAVFAAIAALGRSPADLRHLVLTHGHRDHIGSAAAIVRATGARTYLHPTDIPSVQAGGPFRPMRPAPGLLRRAMCRLMFDPAQRTIPVGIDEPLVPGRTLPMAGGFDVIHVPGHCAGQVALLWRPGRLLLAADTFMNVLGVGDPIGFENQTEGRASQRTLAGLDVAAVAFGHGSPITRDPKGRLRTFVAKHP